jgi:hypothetical protein
VQGTRKWHKKGQDPTDKIEEGELKLVEWYYGIMELGTRKRPLAFEADF